MVEYTAIQSVIANILADGLRHTKEEIAKKISQDMRPAAVYPHIHYMRQKLRPIGQDIICEVHLGKFYYRQVRLLNNSE